MDEEYLTKKFRSHLKSYQDSLKKELKKKEGPYGAGNSFYPISDRKRISWVLDSLRKIGNDTPQLEKEVSKLDEQFEDYRTENEQKFLNQLQNDLGALIDFYGNYFEDFQNKKEYFKTRGDQLYQEYFREREEGLFLSDGYEFDNIQNSRTYIEIIFEYLNDRFNNEELSDKIEVLDKIFKRDIGEVLKILDLDDTYSRRRLTVPYAPKNYWWLHL